MPAGSAGRAMRVEISGASGEVHFTDGHRSDAVWSRLRWSGIGPCVVATGANGRADVWIGGRRIAVGPNSWFKISDSPGLVRRFLTGHDIKTTVGRLWAHIQGDRGFDDDFGSGGGGIRG